MTNRTLIFIKIFFLALAIAVSSISCSNKGTETGNPSMRIQFSTYSQGSVATVAMCVHQIRFKADNSAGETGHNANISAGLVTLSPNGTVITDLSVASGTYRRVDIMVKDECGTGKSLSIQNSAGTFTATTPLTLRFVGVTEVDPFTPPLSLAIAPFIGFFDTVTSDAQLRTGVETIDGQF